jgi:hypothetical protein
MQGNRGVGEHGTQADGVRRLDAVDQLAADLAAFRQDGEARLSRLEQAVSSGMNLPGVRPEVLTVLKLCPRRYTGRRQGRNHLLTRCTAMQMRMMMPPEHGPGCRPK